MNVFIFLNARSAKNHFRLSFKRGRILYKNLVCFRAFDVLGNETFLGCVHNHWFWKQSKYDIFRLFEIEEWFIWKFISQFIVINGNIFFLANTRLWGTRDYSILTTCNLASWSVESSYSSFARSWYIIGKLWVDPSMCEYTPPVTLAVPTWQMWRMFAWALGTCHFTTSTVERKFLQTPNL